MTRLRHGPNFTPHAWLAYAAPLSSRGARFIVYYFKLIWSRRSVIVFEFIRKYISCRQTDILISGNMRWQRSFYEGDYNRSLRYYLLIYQSSTKPRVNKHFKSFLHLRVTQFPEKHTEKRNLSNIFMILVRLWNCLVILMESTYILWMILLVGKKPHIGNLHIGMSWS